MKYKIIRDHFRKCEEELNSLQEKYNTKVLDTIKVDEDVIIIIIELHERKTSGDYDGF